jgi:hypothetical protein
MNVQRVNGAMRIAVHAHSIPCGTARLLGTPTVSHPSGASPHRNPFGRPTYSALDELLESLKGSLRLALRKTADKHPPGDGSERTAGRSEFVGVVEERSLLTV